MEKIILVFILPILLLGGFAGDQVKKAKEPVAVPQADKDLMNKAHLFFQVLPMEATNPENVASLEKKTGKGFIFRQTTFIKRNPKLQYLPQFRNLWS